MKRILNLRTWLIMLVILVAGVLASRTLFKKDFYWNMHDDLQMMRQLEMEKCFQDGQIPCRWVPDMGYGFGFPLFNYYPPLPYLTGEVFRVAGFSFNAAVKLTFALGIIASGYAMFLLSKEFFGDLGGLASSIFYLWAPYHAVDVYVRGAMNESWAWVWFPLALWGVYRLIKKRDLFSVVVLSLSLAALLLTHNLMAMIFAPVFLAWTTYWLVKEKSFVPIPKMAGAGILSLGMVAFFTLPAIFEQKYVHIDTLIQDYYVYSGHFATFWQLFFSRFWGDGPSAFGPNDGLAFPVGHIHWILILIITVLLTAKIIRSKKLKEMDAVAIFGILVGTGAAFMSHERSTFIWLIIPYIQFLQFPWRFLSLNVLGYSFAIGSLFYLLDYFKFLGRISGKIIFLGVLSLALIIFNWNYFKPVRSGPLTDSQKFSGEAWRIQQQAGIRDYLPIGAKKDPASARTVLVETVKGQGYISNQKSGTNWAKFSATFTTKDNTVRINIFDFPIWKAFVDGNESKIYIDGNEQWGRIYVDVPQGQHSLYLKIFDAPLRKVGNLISLLSWLTLFGLVLLVFARKLGFRRKV